MSIQAEVIRRSMRWLARPGANSVDTIGSMRRQTARFTRMSPRPAWGTKTTETTLGGVPVTITTRHASRPERYVLYLHGGGYITGSPRLYRHITWRFADATEARIAALDYRLAPEYPYPSALEDAVSAWHALVAE